MLCVYKLHFFLLEDEVSSSVRATTSSPFRLWAHTAAQRCCRAPGPTRCSRKRQHRGSMLIKPQPSVGVTGAVPISLGLFFCIVQTSLFLTWPSLSGPFKFWRVCRCPEAVGWPPLLSASQPEVQGPPGPPLPGLLPHCGRGAAQVCPGCRGHSRRCGEAPSALWRLCRGTAGLRACSERTSIVLSLFSET